ncbi:UNVERIFIED_ORG: hypothetical protein GGI63_003285 [Rhizobium esperanzae]|nr:hypothetical protein RHECNPAF_1260081 [Rhizobium etli CNPAF512]
MPYIVKVHFEQKYTAVKVTDGHNIYMDTSGKKLENLDVAPGDTYKISVGLFNGAGTIIVDAKDGAADIHFPPYRIPVDCDYDGNIKVPRTAAASQSDVDKLSEEVEAIKQRIGP